MSALPSRWLYRLRAADGTLLYVGCTADLPKRLRRHRSDKPWWPEVAILESEPLPWYEAWAREQHEIRTAPGVHNVTQLETAARGWRTRRARQARLHDAGRRCQVKSCRVCRPYLAPVEAAS